MLQQWRSLQGLRGVHCIVNSWLLSLKIQSSDVGDDDDDDDDDGGGGEDDDGGYDGGDDGGEDGGGEDESDGDDDEEALDSILPLSTWNCANVLFLCKCSLHQFLKHIKSSSYTPSWKNMLLYVCIATPKFPGYIY